MNTPEQIVTEWAKDSTDSDILEMWCIVGVMYRTGLCAKCVVEDSAANEGCECRKGWRLRN